mmetsp:Transcript_23958/g.56740  ORF Transcript_23958/g.56740 Transcript_23958/m.56740 type:complete len:366 (-) Transcript_23958:3668-4765(-)
MGRASVLASGRHPQQLSLRIQHVAAPGRRRRSAGLPIIAPGPGYGSGSAGAQDGAQTHEGSDGGAGRGLQRSSTATLHRERAVCRLLGRLGGGLSGVAVRRAHALRLAPRGCGCERPSADRRRARVAQPLPDAPALGRAGNTSRAVHGISAAERQRPGCFDCGGEQYSISPQVSGSHRTVPLQRRCQQLLLLPPVFPVDISAIGARGASEDRAAGAAAGGGKGAHTALGRCRPVSCQGAIAAGRSRSGKPGGSRSLAAPQSLARDEGCLWLHGLALGAGRIGCGHPAAPALGPSCGAPRSLLRRRALAEELCGRRRLVPRLPSSAGPLAGQKRLRAFHPALPARAARGLRAGGGELEPPVHRGRG